MTKPTSSYIISMNRIPYSQHEIVFKNKVESYLNELFAHIM